MTRYLWALLAMLASATFFDGFDVAILATVAPFVQKQYGLDDGAWGAVVGLTRLGAVVSFFVLIFADRYGRRLLITLTILGYAAFTGLTALSTTVASFTVYQFAARIFLASEFALSLIIIGEEYPTRWRGFGIALLSGVTARRHHRRLPRRGPGAEEPRLARDVRDRAHPAGAHLPVPPRHARDATLRGDRARARRRRAGRRCGRICASRSRRSTARARCW